MTNNMKEMNYLGTTATVSKPHILLPITERGTNDVFNRIGDSITHKKTVIWGTVGANSVLTRGGAALQAEPQYSVVWIPTRYRILVVKFKSFSEAPINGPASAIIPSPDDFLTTSIYAQSGAPIGSQTNINSDYLFDQLRTGNIKILKDKVIYVDEQVPFKRFKIRLKGKMRFIYQGDSKFPSKNGICIYAWGEDAYDTPMLKQDPLYYTTIRIGGNNEQYPMSLRTKTWFKDA